MLNFSTIPKDKPNNNNNVTPGKKSAVIFKHDFKVSSSTGQEYLNVSFKLDEGGFVNENYFDSDKPFLLYKISRLVEACGLSLEGEVSLKDVAKLIDKKPVIVDVIINDRGYPALDYSGDKQGIYSPKETTADDSVDMNAAPTLDQAIETELSDDSF